MSQVSDELLVAYLDGQLDAPQAHSVERMAGQSEDLRTRLERLKRSQAYLIQTFETLARRARASAQVGDTARSGSRPASHPSREAPGPPRSAPAPRATAFRQTHLRAAASAAAEEAPPAGPRSSLGRKLFLAVMMAAMAGVLGYGTAQWMRTQDLGGLDKISARVPAPAGRWADDVARLHAHFIAASVSADPQSQTNRDLVELQLSRVASASVPVPNFTDHDLTFQRGQVLSYRGSRMMQLSYTNADGQLVALYVMAGGPRAKATASVQGDVTMVTWSRDGVRYMVAGEMPETSLRALAAVSMAQIAGR